MKVYLVRYQGVQPQIVGRNEKLAVLYIDCAWPRAVEPFVMVTTLMMLRPYK